MVSTVLYQIDLDCFDVASGQGCAAMWVILEGGDFFLKQNMIAVVAMHLCCCRSSIGMMRVMDQ